MLGDQDGGNSVGVPAPGHSCLTVSLPVLSEIVSNAVSESPRSVVLVDFNVHTMVSQDFCDIHDQNGFVPNNVCPCSPSGPNTRLGMLL